MPGVDFDPEVARTLHGKGLSVRFGDATEADCIESLPLAGAVWVICTLPDFGSNLGLLHALREHKYPGEIAVIAREQSECEALKRLGVPTVLYPMNNAVDYVVSTLTSIVHPDEREQ